MSEFHTTQPPLAKYEVNFLRLAWLSILFLVLPIVFIISGMVSFDRDLFLIFPLVVIPFGIFIYRAILLLTNSDLEILVFDDGFTYSNKGKTRKYTWKEIDKVWTTKYRLIGIIFVNYIRVKILDTSGNILIVDRTLQKVDKFEALLQEQIAKDKFPQALTRLQLGMSLEYAGITLTKDHINNRHDKILWSELGDLQIWQGTIRLWKKGQQAISILASIPSIPNFTLLMSLIRYLSKAAQTPPLPWQDMKNEKDKSPEKLQQAVALIKSGDKEGAQRLLFESISSDPDNEAAWLWLVSAVPPEERIFCLEKALTINPNNLQARQYLEKLKASQPSEPIKSKTAGTIKPGGNLDARLSGLFILVLGAGLGYWQIVTPIIKALRHAAYIDYVSEAVVLAPIAILFGLFLLVFGAEGLGFLSKPPSKAVLVFLLIGVLILAFAGYFGMEHFMKSLGYY
jgi:tetratricopeptide (TPR) repeat protein